MGWPHVQVAGAVTSTIWIYAGAGDDRIKGGAGNNVVLGEAGNDLLVGGDNRDILIGGIGEDRILGNAADDILIAGALNFGTEQDAALQAILKEWTSSREYGQRMSNIMGAQSTYFADRENGDYFLKVDGASATVLDDNAKDTLTGSAGKDWFFGQLDGDAATVKDKLTDLSATEFAADIDFILGQV